MKINLPIRQTVEADIDEKDAFRILCKSLDMEELIFNEKYDDAYVTTYESGDNEIWANCDGHDKVIDDRGDLFIALRNLACCLYPNLPWRGADYIYVERES